LFLWKFSETIWANKREAVNDFLVSEKICGAEKIVPERNSDKRRVITNSAEIKNSDFFCEIFSSDTSANSENTIPYIGTSTENARKKSEYTLKFSEIGLQRVPSSKSNRSLVTETSESRREEVSSNKRAKRTLLPTLKGGKERRRKKDLDPKISEDHGRKKKTRANHEKKTRG
jgi:hypothetical protein